MKRSRGKKEADESAPATKDQEQPGAGAGAGASAGSQEKGGGGGGETKVVKLQRKNGVVTQGCDVYIGRAWGMGGWRLQQSQWANPFSVKQCGSAAKAVARFREYIKTREDLLGQLETLRGKTLGCWCKPGPCHGDVLVELLQQRASGGGKDAGSSKKGKREAEESASKEEHATKKAKSSRKK